jgi:hypothetical protein
MPVGSDISILTLQKMGEYAEGRAAYLIHSYRLSVQTDLVHDSCRIFSILLTDELDEAIALV